MELIDRQELAQQIHYMKVAVNTINTDYNTGYHSACSGIEGLIASIPTIEAEPKHGRWEHKIVTEDYHVTGQCSLCKERRRVDNYCPNCGADMREVEE